VKALIITADDFGFSRAVNEAVDEAHVNGVLGTASLMVGAEEAADAVERALRLPNLKVGLHIVLTGSRPVSPPSAIPDLVGPDGRLSSRLFESGVRFFFARASAGNWNGRSAPSSSFFEKPGSNSTTPIAINTCISILPSPTSC